MTDEAWRKELRQIVLPLLDQHLATLGLPTLPRAKFETLISYEPQPRDGNPVTWFHDAKAGVERIVRDRVESAAEPPGATAVPVDEPLPANDHRWAALAEILAIEAHENPYVVNWRSSHLRDGLLQDEAATTLRAQLDREALQELAGVAATLIDRHGWWDHDEATIFVLTGNPPAGRRIQAKITVRDRTGATRVTIDADPRASPEAVADSYRRARSQETLTTLNLPSRVEGHHRLKGARPHPVNEKNAALAIHLARNRDGTWADRRSRWNAHVARDHQDWNYSADSAFARDAGRAWAQVVGEDFVHRRPALRSLI